LLTSLSPAARAAGHILAKVRLNETKEALRSVQGRFTFIDGEILEENMAIGVVATIKIKPGTNEAFEAVAKELMAAVRASEPGNKVYQFCKSRTDATTYVVLEIYTDEAAIEAHGKSEHFRTIGAKMGPSMAGRPEVQYLDAV
jgi:quinol monooxygenase YgiN